MKALIITLALTLSTKACFVDQLVGKVTKVNDGDTLNVPTNDNQTQK